MSLLDSLNIPTLPPQRVPLKTLIEQLQPSSDNKRLIMNAVGRIDLVSLLNDQTIHIRPYKDDEYSYQAIYVLQITLKKEERLTDLSIQLHSAFPEPTIILFNLGEKEWISVAPKRLNKLDQTKTVIDDIVVQQLNNESNQYINFNNITAIDLKDYYQQIIQLIYKVGVYNVIHVFPNIDMDYKSVIKEYQQITVNISKLKEQYKKATMKSEKMSIDDQIYDEEIKQKRIMKELKGDI